MQTITKETERGYEWINDTDFQDAESLCAYLDQVGAKYKRNGFTVKANLDDVRKAEAAYNKEMQEESDYFSEYEL